MQSLYESLLPIFEAMLSKADYTKHNFLYANGVIEDLLNSKVIKIGKNGESVVNLDPTEQEEFRKLWDSGKITFPETKDDFDNMVSKYPSFPKWNEIYKGKYSGKDDVTAGQKMEGLVCYVFNEENPDIDAWAKSNPSIQVTQDWIDSCNWTVDFMEKQTGVSNDNWNRDNYIACRVDGDDFRLDSKYSFASIITSLFQGTKQMKRVLKFDCSDLYSGAKDTWNKADIVLVHKQKGISFMEDLKTAGVNDGESLNNFLISKTIDGTIIPISLKQLTKPNAHLSEVNIESKDMPIDIIDSVQYLRIADKYAEKKYTGNVDIICRNGDNEGVMITFRADTNGANGLNVEPKPTKGQARFGKAVAVMKSWLGLKKGNDYYIVKDTNEDAIKELESYGFKIEVKPKSNYNKVDPSWKDRSCVAGLLGMLSHYKTKISQRPDKEFPVQFANFCMLCSMGLNSKGAFYKISD